MIYTIYPCPYRFAPLYHFAPCIILPLCHFAPPWKSFNDLMIYTIYPCPVSFCPSVSFCPLYHFAPLSFCPPPPPLKSFNDLRYLPMSRIILPPGFILPPYHFAPYHFAPPPPPPWKSFTVFSPEISDSIGAFSRSRGTRRWRAMLHNFLHMSGTVLVPVHVKHIIALQIYWTV